MVKVYKNNVLQDYLRTAQGERGYGLQIANNMVPMPLYNAFSGDYPVSSFNLVRIDSGVEILATISLSTSLLKYVNGQYLIDSTKVYGVTIPEGVYYYEIATSHDIFYSEIFKIQYIEQPFRSSSALLSSEEKLVSDAYE